MIPARKTPAEVEFPLPAGASVTCWKTGRTLEGLPMNRAMIMASTIPTSSALVRKACSFAVAAAPLKFRKITYPAKARAIRVGHR